MMSGARGESVRAERAARRARRSPYRRRTFVIRLELADLGPGQRRAPAPVRLERGAVARGVERVEKFLVGADRLFDEVARRRGEDRAPLGVVGIKKGRSAPARERRGELPAEIGRILEPGIDAIAAIGRMAVRRVAR